jgi:hypothetical protein
MQGFQEASVYTSWRAQERLAGDVRDQATAELPHRVQSTTVAVKAWGTFKRDSPSVSRRESKMRAPGLSKYLNRRELIKCSGLENLSQGPRMEIGEGRVENRGCAQQWSLGFRVEIQPWSTYATSSQTAQARPQALRTD